MQKLLGSIFSPVFSSELRKSFENPPPSPQTFSVSRVESRGWKYSLGRKLLRLHRMRASWVEFMLTSVGLYRTALPCRPRERPRLLYKQSSPSGSDRCFVTSPNGFKMAPLGRGRIVFSWETEEQEVDMKKLHNSYVSGNFLFIENLLILSFRSFIFHGAVSKIFL